MDNTPSGNKDLHSMYLTIFLYLSWGMYVKSIGIVYLLYYAVNIGYDILKSSQNRPAEAEEMVYEMPMMTDIQTVEVKFQSQNDASEIQNNNINSDISEAEIEEYSMSVTEYLENHKQNINKAIKAFG